MNHLATPNIQTLGALSFRTLENEMVIIGCVAKWITQIATGCSSRQL